MKTTDQLSHDHQAILRGLQILKAAASSWKRYPLNGEDDCRSVLEFLKTFADRCHHGKEEQVLFPKLIEVGMPVDDGPLGMMLYEHEEGRQLIRGMESALNSRHPGDFAYLADRYAELLENHIAKEDNILFRRAEHVVAREEDESMFRRFEEIEHEMGEDTHDRFHKMLDTLGTRYLPLARS